MEGRGIDKLEKKMIVKGGTPHLQRKINREPRRHIPALALRPQRMRRQLDLGVQHRFEIARQAVHAAAVGGREGEACGSRVVFVVIIILTVVEGNSRRRRRRRSPTPRPMRKGPRFLDDRRRRRCRRRRGGIPIGRWLLRGQVVEGVQHDDVRGIGGRGVREGAAGDVGVEFGRRDGGEVGGVAAGDGEAVGGVEVGVGEGVEAFGGELVVGEGAEEFGDEDVDFVGLGLRWWLLVGLGRRFLGLMGVWVAAVVLLLLLLLLLLGRLGGDWAFPRPHIGLDEVDLVGPGVFVVIL